MSVQLIFDGAPPARVTLDHYFIVKSILYDGKFSEANIAIFVRNPSFPWRPFRPVEVRFGNRSAKVLPQRASTP